MILLKNTHYSSPHNNQIVEILTCMLQEIGSKRSTMYSLNITFNLQKTFSETDLFGIIFTHVEQGVYHDLDQK